ncbi:MAG: acyl-CoA/acyl-ACP dehydrogenase [Spirochaetes bacterium]|jgi:alkylation response protein AidB-like acyl-CoA dehydrogenase|nr:acyl-CoA/acyl-ACP dehydrogenase [Spirochaetota bacterium]
MDFSFNSDQAMIRDTARKFLENECPKEKTRELMKSDKGFDPGIYRQMVELGWAGLIIPEQFGGSGMSYLDLMIIMEEIGRNLCPGPFYTTVAQCSLPIIAFGTEQQKKDILPKIASEGQIWTLALLEAPVSWEASGINLSAKAEGDNYVLNGTKLFVQYANSADMMLVIGRTGASGLTAFMVDAKSPGITMTVIPTQAKDNRCEVVFNNVKVPKTNVLGKVDNGYDVVDYIVQNAAALKSAEMAGGAQYVLDITTQYCKERIQFDKPLGAFQAIQHKLADILIDIDGLKFLVWESSWQISENCAAPRIVSMTKLKANSVYQQTCIDCMIAQGAMGFTNEMDIGLYHLRTKMNEFECGGSDFHKERITKDLENIKPEYLSL